MLNGRNVSFSEIAGVSPPTLLLAKQAAEECISFYSRIRGLAEVQTDPDLAPQLFKDFNDAATEAIQSHDIDWRQALNPTVLAAISLGNAGHDTTISLELGITLPTVHAAAWELNDLLWRWIAQCGGVADGNWEEVWSMPQLPPQLLDELITRIDHEWRNATAAAERRQANGVASARTTSLATHRNTEPIRNPGGAPATNEDACKWAWERRQRLGLSYAALAKAFNEAHPDCEPTDGDKLRSGINYRLKAGKLQNILPVENHR